MPQLTTETLAKLMELARESDEAAAQTKMAPYLGDLRPVGSRPWQEFPNRSVAAYIMHACGQLAPALALSIESFRLRGPDDLGTALIARIRHDLFNSAGRALHYKRPDIARPMLEGLITALKDVGPLTEERALLDLMSFLDAVPQVRAPVPAKEGIRPTVVYLAIWGERFIDAAERNFFACCAAPGNVPELARLGPVTLHIHTRQADVDRVLGSAAVRALAAHAEIEVTPIPEAFFIESHAINGMGYWSRMILAALAYDGLMHAYARQADFCQMGADILLSQRFLSSAKRRLANGVGVLVTSPVRAIESRLFEDLDARGCRQGPCLDIDSETLYHASMKALHPFIAQSFIRKTPTRLPVDPVFFYFPTADGFAAHGFQFHCSMFDTRLLRPGLGYDLHTLDGRLLSDLIEGRDPAKICYVHAEPPGDMFHVCVDSAAGVSSFGNFELSPAGSVRAAIKWISRREDLPYMQWAVRQRIHYRMPPGVPLAVPPDCRDEEQTISDIVELLGAQQPDIDKKFGELAAPPRR